MKKIKVIFGFVAIIAMMMIQACSSGEGPLDEIMTEPTNKPITDATIKVKVTIVNNIPGTYTNGYIEYSMQYSGHFDGNSEFENVTPSSPAELTKTITKLPTGAMKWNDVLGKNLVIDLHVTLLNYKNDNDSGTAYSKNFKISPNGQQSQAWNNETKTFEFTFTLSEAN